MPPSRQPRSCVIVVENLPVPFDRRVWQEAQALTRAGWTVSVICPFNADFPKRFEVIDDIAIYRHRLPPEGRSAFAYFREYSTALFHEFRLLFKVHRERGFSIIQACNPPLPERVMKYHVTESGVRFNDKIVLPFEPFIGTLGVSPQIEAVLSLQPDYWGGNMDLPDVAPGAVAYFPVQMKGANLFLGDCHGRQGDGELCGVAVEIPSTTTIHVDLIKSWAIVWPRLENERFIMTIGSARPMEDAARIAYRELIRWLAADYGFDELEAYFLLTQAGRMRVGNMVDPKYTLGASILKEYLPS